MIDRDDYYEYHESRESLMGETERKFYVCNSCDEGYDAEDDPSIVDDDGWELCPTCAIGVYDQCSCCDHFWERDVDIIFCPECGGEKK